MRGLIVLLLSFLVVSCASTHLKKGLGELKGKEIDTAFDVLGYPTREQEFNDKTVFVWEIDEPQMNSICTIKLPVDDNDRITGYEYRGNQRGCQGYARRLYDYYKSDTSSSATSTSDPPSH